MVGLPCSRKWFPVGCLAALCALAIAPTPGRTAKLASPAAPPQVSPDVVSLQAEHIYFHPSDTVALEVERLNGRMVATPGKIISLDDKTSYTVHVDQAVTRLSSESLSNLVNGYLVRVADSAIRHVDISFEGSEVVIHGEVHKLLPLPFEGRGVISATPAGEMRLHMNEFRVAGVLNKGFLGFFGVHLDAVAKPKHTPSFRVEGDDFITPLSSLFPPPVVYGRLTRVKIEKQRLVQVIGIQAEHHAVQTIIPKLKSPANYVYFTGGRMRFGKVTMDNVDLRLVNRTPHQAFGFSLDRYQEQIQNGYVKVLPSLGLVVYAEDFEDLKHPQTQ